MSERDVGGRTGELVFAFAIEAPPEKVWRAIAKPEFRSRWLPDRVLAETTPLSVIVGRELRFRMRDEDRPTADTTVTFRIEPGAGGGTTLTIVHEIPQTHGLAAANGGRPLMRAA